MRHRTSTIQRLDPEHGELPIGDRPTREARTWLLCRLRWEHRLAELRAEHLRDAHDNDCLNGNPSA